MLSEDELIDELKKRFAEKRRALSDLSRANEQLLLVNERLGRAEALKSDFLSNIRNEINNPLSSIMGLARSLSHAPPGAESVAMAETIYAEAQALDFQLRNIFVAADLEAGECVPAIACVDLVSLVGNSIDSFSRIARKRGVTMDFRAGEEEGEGRFLATDAGMLEVIVANLLANAIEFSPEGGVVVATLAIRERCLFLSVADSGPGIAPGDRMAIFERFRQLDSGSRKRHHGHGLGLSITRALLELLGGVVDVACESDEGSIFRVTLPELQWDDEGEVLAEDGNLFIFPGSGQGGR